MSTSVQQLIDGLYIAFYNRAADQPGYLFWEQQVSLNQTQATSTFVQDQNYQFANPLGNQFFSTQSTYFNSTYGALSNSAFINQIYVNFGGSAADANGLAYWVGKLGTQNRQTVAYEIAQDFLTITLTPAAQPSLSASDLAAAVARQQTFDNKIAVSEAYATASATNAFLVAKTASTTDPAFVAAIDIVQGITADPATVTAAEAEITKAVAAGNVTPITSATTTPPPAGGQTFTLTLGTDTIPGSGAGGDTINAPILFNGGTGTQITTLQAGDTITETGTGNQLNLTVGASDKTITGATVSGVQTFNITNTGFAATPANPIIQGSGITGLTSIVNLNSSKNVIVGSAATPLSAVLTNVGVSSTSSSPNLTNTAVFINTTALAGTSDALTVSANNAGSATAAAFVLAGAATGNNGYESITVNATGTDFIGIGNPVAGVNTTNTVKVTGAGSLTLYGDATAGDFAKLATIDASAAQGPVTITGAVTGLSAAGILTGDTALTSIKGGAGSDLVDVSSMTLAKLVSNGTAIDLGAGTNTLVVDDSVATTAVALTGIANVQILGDATPGTSAASVDFSKLPASINTFQLFGPQGMNPITLINAPSTFTFNEGIFGSPAALTNITAAGTGTSDVLTIDFGVAASGNTPAMGNANPENFKIAGYETINLAPTGGQTNIDLFFADPSAGGSETVNIGGAVPVFIDAVVLSGSATALNDTDTALVKIGATTALKIDAHASGGLLMEGPVVFTTPIGGGGSSIIGSASASNILVGSNGNDSFTGGTGTDIIVTDGGADTVNLGATHISDHVELYGFGMAVPTLNSVQVAQSQSIVDPTENAQTGFYGNTSTGTFNIFTRFAGTGDATTFGTSASQAIVNNFQAQDVAGHDVIDISFSAFGSAAAHKGLVAVDGTTPAALGNVTQVMAGVLSGTTGTLVDVPTGGPLVINNAGTLAMDLMNGSLAVSLSAGTTNNNTAHLLFAYQDSSNNTHIADVAILEKTVAGPASLAAQQHIVAEDLVQLTGVPLSHLANSNVHIVA